MQHQAKNYRDLPAFLESLKSDIRQWLADTKTKQYDLAALLGFHSAYVSASLRAGTPMTEEFISRLSGAVPYFSHAIIVYFELKTGRRANAATHRVLDRARADRDLELMTATREAEEAVARLAAVVRSYVKRG
jgi:hypothetical protein